MRSFFAHGWESMNHPGSSAKPLRTFRLLTSRHSALTSLSCRHLRVELRRLTLRHAERFPPSPCEVFGEQHDLPHVMRIMRKLSMDGLHYAVRLAANRHRAVQVLIHQRVQRTKQY